MARVHDDYFTARRVRAAVEAADDFDLAFALIQPDEWGGCPVRDKDLFHCPLCQSLPSQWLLSGPAALFGSELTWWCTRCGGQGTRWTLIRLVLESPAALSRFLERLPAAA